MILASGLYAALNTSSCVSENPRQGNNKYLAYEIGDDKMHNELAIE
jgi:hypothetical protein